METQQNESAIRMPVASDLLVSSSPHLHDQSHSAASVKRIMLCVIAALMPACLTGIYYFGFRALLLLVVSVCSCVFFEWLWTTIARQKTTLGDYSAVVSGLILAMNLSAGFPLWLVVLGAMVTMWIGKMLYGGIGYNPFNPAAVGRVFLLLSFPAYMTTWVPVTPLFGSSTAAAFTGATPLRGRSLTALASEIPYWDYFTGNMPGCLGETCSLALLAGGLFLIALKLIKWQVPLAYLATIAVSALLAGWLVPESVKTLPDPLFQLLTGGVMLAAFFMCTDMVTTPITTRGGVIFGVGAGLITVVIRFWGSYPEGASFSILLMNALTPLIDRYTVLKPFGYRKPVKSAVTGGAK